IDIVMIDLLRAGGITQWMKIAGMAEAFNLPVVSHLVPEIHVHLIAAIPNGLTVEDMPRTLSLYAQTPPTQLGQLVSAKKPGRGRRSDLEAMKRFQAVCARSAARAISGTGPDRSSRLPSVTASGRESSVRRHRSGPRIAHRDKRPSHPPPRSPGA